MSILVVDVGGSNQTTLTCQKGGHAAPRRAGSLPVSHAGTQTSSVRAELMVVPVILTELTPTSIATLRDLFANGAQVDCSGDVFNNGNATVTCSGMLSDDFLPAGPWFVGNLTLYEIGTGLGFGGGGSNTTTFFLTTTPSGVGGGILDANPVGNIGFTCFRVLDSATPATCSCPPAGSSTTCPITYSLVPERSWITGPLAAGFLTGTPRCVFISKGINGSSGVAVQSTKAILYLVRSGVDVNSWETDYVAGTFFGGDITMTFPSGLLVPIQDNDRLRVEIWGRLALLCGWTDSNPYVLARQTICYPGALYVNSGVTLLPP